MSALFTKLNLGTHTAITVLEAPASFEPALAELEGVTITRTIRKGAKLAFAMAFATTQRGLDTVSAALAAAAEGDAIIWIAYPKKSSKRYTCEFNRDSGWAVLGAAGFETVRMVTIDDDWSALRFRRTTFVKSLARRTEIAISDEGKARTRKT